MADILLGYDVGSSSIKAAALDAESGACLAAAASPERELAIDSPHPGWAEQDPAVWWEHLVGPRACWAGGRTCRGSGPWASPTRCTGWSCLDEDGQVLRPAIIWCDSRAVAVGERAFQALGPERCLERLLNSPGNFTASKLAWVRENEPEIFARVHRALLPGD